MSKIRHSTIHTPQSKAMDRALDRLLTFAASLKLAIITILLLAAYLAVGTLYESRFGTRAAAAMVYQSAAFYGVMVLLAINVMAAAIVRFPWKRHQTGFVITHIGIEVLLLGCLIGARWGTDGRMILRPGQGSMLIELPTEQLAFRANEQVRPRLVAIDPARLGTYPSVPAFLLGEFWSAQLPPTRPATRPRLPEYGGLTIDLLEIAPAARVETRFSAADAGDPAAQVRIFGSTPDGVPVDQLAWFSPDHAAELFGGEIRLRFRRDAPNDAPADAAAQRQRARGELVLSPDGQGWRGMILGSAGVRESFAVEPGKQRPGWMGLNISVEQVLPHAKPETVVTPIRVPADRVDSSIAAARLRVAYGQQSVAAWIVRGEPFTQINVAGYSVQIAYGFEASELPFEVRLAEASTAANGTPSAVVEVARGGETVSLPVRPNVPGVVDGRAIYLSSVERVAGAPVAFLSVRHDPGWPVKYAGSGLIVLGTVMMFVIKRREVAPGTAVEVNPRSIAAVLPQATVMHRAVLLLTIPMLLGSVARGDVNLDAVRTIPVQYGDRVAPLDTLARDTVRFIRGRETADSLKTVLDWSADPAAAEAEAVISVQRLDLRAVIGLRPDVKFIAPAKLREDAPAMRWLAEIADRQRRAAERGELPGFTPTESAGLELHRRLAAFDSVTSRSIYRISTIANPASAAAMVEQMLSLYAAGRGRELEDFARKLSSPLSEWERSRLEREVLYYSVHPFRYVAQLYGITLLALIVAAVRRRSLGRGALVVLGIAIAAHAAAFAWRCSITGWAPVTNMYETVVWVGGVAAVLGLVLGVTSRATIAVAAGAVLALLACIVGDVMPAELGSSVQTLAPVLQSNLWLTVHVLTVVSSYAAFAMALVLGNVLLWKLARSENDEARMTNDEAQGMSRHSSFEFRHSSLAQLIYRTIQIGVVLIAAGTVLGAMWADVSWGRFWGWDPKEVWALVVLLAYLALLHGKAAGWVGPFGLAAGAVCGFLTVLMSWYGVNFVLGVGLHSYGFGRGGFEYVLTYVAIQLAFVVWATWRYRMVTLPAGNRRATQTDPGEASPATD